MFIDSQRNTIHDDEDLENEINRITKLVGHPITIFYHQEENTAIMLYFDKAICVGRQCSKAYNNVRYAWWYNLEETRGS